MALYYPRIKIADPLNEGNLRLSAPSGSIAGLYARIDSRWGVWRAPAGVGATIVGAQGLEYELTDSENGPLNQLGVNCIRTFPTYGIVAWGASTWQGESSPQDDYKYISVRRLALYIEESLYQGTQWAVFEQNDEELWSQLRLNVNTFMDSLFRAGALSGSTQDEAYFVRCDSSTMTPDDIEHGIVNIVVGFAPINPAEFVVITIQQIVAQNAA